MITTKIKVKPHIAEYCYGKYTNGEGDPVRFPHNIEIYHTIWDLLIKRPANAPIDQGNLEIHLPNSKMRTELGFVKNPSIYNYLSARSVKMIERKIETFMFAEIHDMLYLNKQAFGIDFSATVHHFMCKYGIDSVTEDMFIKNFYRWRNNLLRRKIKRNYTQIR